jgi:phosphoglycerate kinase
MRTIQQAGDLKGRRVFLRADFDVPVAGDSIVEPFRIQRQREGLQMLIAKGAHVVIGAHISAVPSFEPLKHELERILGVSFGTTVTILENLRSNPGEEANDVIYARTLADGCDAYVNNAFAVCHRSHASVDALARVLPSYAGPLIQEEVRQLSEVIAAPSAGKVIFIGGAKVSTKMPVVEYLLDKAEAIAVGGKIANELGAPSDARVHVPSDFVIDNGQKLDIGPETAAAYAALARNAERIVWNGPMGKWEDPRYAAGTRALAEAIAASPAQKLIGGGDTVSAVRRFGLLDAMGFVSTGGGAMLAFLAGERLPGLHALGYYDAHTL